MSLQHFFLDNQVLEDAISSSNNDGFELLLSDEDLRHAKALRLNPKEHIGVIDANGIFYECEIVSFDKSLIVINTQRSINKTEDRFEIWLCPAIAKGHKLDDVVRACTEIGIDGFIPFISDRCISVLNDKKQDNKIDRWQKIAKSASMQSGRMSIPKIYNICNIDKLCDLLKDFDCVYVCWEESVDTSCILETSLNLKKSKDLKKVAIIVGPEGGLTSEEVDQISSCNKNSHVVSLGSTILRTQTADIVAPAIVKYLLTC